MERRQIVPDWLSFWIFIRHFNWPQWSPLLNDVLSIDRSIDGVFPCTYLGQNWNGLFLFGRIDSIFNWISAEISILNLSKLYHIFCIDFNLQLLFVGTRFSKRNSCLRGERSQHNSAYFHMYSPSHFISFPTINVVQRTSGKCRLYISNQQIDHFANGKLWSDSIFTFEHANWGTKTNHMTSSSTTLLSCLWQTATTCHIDIVACLAKQNDSSVRLLLVSTIYILSLIDFA